MTHSDRREVSGTKRKLKIAASCAVTFALTLMLVIHTGRLMRPVNTDRSIQTIETFHALPENSVEVMVYGSSHAWKGLDVMTMYKKYGIGAYNYGCNWQKLNTTYLFLEDSLRTQSPKVALIETFCFDQLLYNADLNGEIYYTRALPETPAKWRYLRQCFGRNLEGYLSYYLPLTAFHDNWVNLEEKSFYAAGDTGIFGFDVTMGYERMDGIEPVSLGDWRSFEQREFSEASRKILDSMVQLCRDNGVKIVFYTVPWEGDHYYHDALQRYADENGCVYLDLFEKMKEFGLDETTDFYDKGHVNHRGAVKVAAYLGRYLAEHYDLTDLRDTGDNAWEQALVLWDQLQTDQQKD